MTNIPPKKSGLYTQIPTPQTFLDSKMNFYNDKIFSEPFWTLAFLDPPHPSISGLQMRPKIGSHFDSGLEKPPPPPFWTSPESFRGKLNEAFPNSLAIRIDRDDCFAPTKFSMK